MRPAAQPLPRNRRGQAMDGVYPALCKPVNGIRSRLKRICRRAHYIVVQVTISALGDSDSMFMAYFRRCVCGFWCLLLVAMEPALGQTAKPLIIGLTPNLSTRYLLLNYQPLQHYLGTRLKQPVTLYTAPNYSEYYQRTMQGEFDVVLMPAHLAQLLQSEAQWVLLAQFAQQQKGLILVRQDSAITHVNQLLGKTIAFSDRLSLNTLFAEDWFSQKGWGHDFMSRSNQYFSNHATAIQAVVIGRVTAAIVASVPYRQASEEFRKEVRVIGSTGSFPPNVFLANPALPAALIQAVQRALLEFGQTPSGNAWLSQTELGGIRTAVPADLKKIEPYAKRAKLIMQRETETMK